MIYFKLIFVKVDHKNYIFYYNTHVSTQPFDVCVYTKQQYHGSHS
jgi:hypothetical protein